MDNFAYFFVFYPKTKKEDASDIEFVIPENKEHQPECIFFEETYDSKTYFYKKVFRVNKAAAKGKKATSYDFEFDTLDDKYHIFFDSKGSTFIYDVNLEVSKKILPDIKRKTIQNKIEYTEKMNCFEEALKKANEESKIDNLHKETIDLFSKKNGFSLLIALFLKIYKKKDLCSQLLKIFREINEKKPKDNEKNMDRKSNLKDYTSIFDDIQSEAEELIKSNGYSTVDFYGIILCYLNYYDYNNFTKVMRSLLSQSSEDLYEILLIYTAHFKNKINEDLDFFNGFIKYAILNKDFPIFQSCLNYIKDYDTYISVIESNKEDYFERYLKANEQQKNERHIIKLDKNLLLKSNNDSKEKQAEAKTEAKNKNEVIITSTEANNTDTKKTLQQIKEEKNSNIEKKNMNHTLLKIIKKINSIITFCDLKNIFIIFFTNEFWKEMLNYCSEPNQDGIYFCSKLRDAFTLYHNLVIKIFEKKEKKKFTIKNEAMNYFDNDEFAFILDHIIRKYIDNNKEITNIEKLAFITQYNPYYIEPKYHSKVDADIFNSFDLNSIDDEFVEDFRKMKFEKIFEQNIGEFINKLTSKIKSISNFDAIIKLINIKNIKEKNVFLDSLSKKYDSIIRNEIGLLTGKDLDEAIKVVAKISLINYIYQTKEKQFRFINSKVKKLSKNIIPLIFIEIIKICLEKENKQKNKEEQEEQEIQEIQEESDNFDFKEMKNYIFDEFTNKLDNINDIDNIINLLDCLGSSTNEEKDKEKNEGEQISTNYNKNDEIINEFLKKLMEKHSFKKEEFFSKNQNLKITLLYKLFEKGKIKKSEEEYYLNIEDLLQSIRKDIDGDIKKKTLDEFLKNDKSFIIQRLSLINIILEAFNASKEYEKLVNKHKEINENINKLRDIKDNIIIYYKETHQDIIKRLMDTIQSNQNKKIKEYKGGRIGELIEDIRKLEEKVEQIKKVKNFLLFNVIYDLNAGKNEEDSFNNAYNILEKIGNLLKENTDIIKLYEQFKEIFDTIKERLSNNETRAQEFIKNLIEYYEINNENLIDELTILFKSKKYELDINSMIFFFKYFEKNNESWNNKLSEKYENLSSKDFTEIKTKLNELKTNKIYDYQNVQNYNRLFTCLYEKKQAIEFLFSKTSKDIDQLKDKIQPTDRTISIKDIIDTENCNSDIIKMKKLQDNNKIFQYIQTMNEKTIKQFENYSRVYQSVIELDNNDEDSDNLYEQVYDIINDASFNILQDSETFLHRKQDDKGNSKYEQIKLEDLIHLKNRIHIKNEKEEKSESSGDDKLKIKRKIMAFYKNTISDIEVIIEYMNVLRNKGSSLPIKITISINIKNDEPSITYHLGEEKSYYKRIRDFLFKAKTSYITQLERMYKDKLNLRFLYGKQFRSIMKHLESSVNMDSFLRYILNITDNNKKVEEGFKAVTRHVKDWINQYEIYNKDSLESSSEYITSLFQKNDKALEDHYNKIRIVSNTNDRGLALHECANDSMEEYIINLYWDKIHELPIAQNVLITNKETSTEEIQAYFHRAILCNYNTLFVVEINDSFSEYQQSKMNNYIDSLLSYKNQRFNEECQENIDKKETRKYLDSYIVFVYNKDNKNITSFLKEIKKYTEGNIRIENNDTNNNDKINQIIFEVKEKDNNFLSELGNVKVITSEICGLGKSEKIKKIIKDNKQKYFHFPLGGILTKNDIYEKLKLLLEKIKNENYKDIAIHLDLTESKEKSIMNEFFFSFLVTKFYSNSENILYIPKDISIYIEIPNCFEDYMSKFSILNIFNKENITFDNMPEFNYSENMIDIFNRMLGIKSNAEIKEFVKKYIGIKKYSFHQINIFIKLFISQYSKFNTKIKFLSNGVDVTEERIKQFALCTLYFTNGGYAQLLTGLAGNQNNEMDYIDKLSSIYDNDLHREFPTPLIFIIKEKMIYDKLFIPTKESSDYQNCKDYLKRIKEILNLPNDVEKDEKELKSLISIIEEKNNNYVITNDNFKKMVLLVYRIKANVPVIIMGDTGCGKTALITKLNQILNNGQTTVEIINIHPGITDEKLCKLMDEKNEIAQKKKDEELWVFFDELNTCLSMSLLTEIFINREYNGKKLCDNIRLIGACNPYRKRKGGKEKCGLSMSDDNENELVYLVEPLPQSLLYYVFSFGSIDNNDEKKYIHSIIEKLFTIEEKNLHEITRDAISKCHIYLRETFDPSVVSLREIARFSKCIEFFMKYFTKKNNYLSRVNNDKNNKLRSIICSIYLCYYIRLTDDKKRANFEVTLRPLLLQLINNEKNIEEKGGNLIEQIKNEDLKNEIMTRPEETINAFSDFIRIEQEFILNQIELDKGIGKNTLLKENVFLLFLSVVTSIPLIIIGKPGCGKSLSAQLINKSMRGKYSKNKFFQLFPQIIQAYFQGSESSEPEDVENLFDRAEKQLNHFKKKNEELPIIMVLFDELGLAERSKKNPLKVLHSKLEYGGKEEGVSFVGISNYTLDAAKINRAMVLSVPDLDQRLDEIIQTSQNIVESISGKLKKDPIFEILSKTYFDYKDELQFIKELVVYKQFRGLPDIQIRPKVEEEAALDENEPSGKEEETIASKEKVSEKEKPRNGQRERRQFEAIKKLAQFIDLLKKEDKIRKDFHGNRDFYSLIKGIAIELARLGDISYSDKVPIIIRYIERNLGGIQYEIDIDIESSSSLDDIRERVLSFKNMLEDYESYEEGKIIKLNSVFLFKKLYNSQFEKDPNNLLQIDKLKINDYNLNNCINENIKDINSRYLLLQVMPSLTTLIYQNIKLQNPFKEITLYSGSPFIDDNNKEYRFKKINEIQDDARFDKLIVLENLNQIHPFLFDLYNRNYIVKDEKNFIRICLENANEQLTLVNDRFRIIIFVDKRFVNKCDLAFLNRLEKMILSFDQLLDENLKLIAKNLIEEFRFRNIIRKYNNMNYSLKDLMINCGNEDIQGLIYYFSKESKTKDSDTYDDTANEQKIDENELREKVIDKLYKILPQDIICVLNDNNILKAKYNELKNIYNYIDFKDFINKEENLKYKISIIYTYTSIANSVEGLNKEMRFMVSEIRSEDGLKNLIEEIQKGNELKKTQKDYIICIHFEQSNSKNIKFISNFLLTNFKNDNYKYVFIVHINRNFNKKKADRIYSLPDINPSIYQIFIDDLNNKNNIRLNDLLTKDIKEILQERRDDLKLNDEFKKALKNFLNNELSGRQFFVDSNDYINEILNYMDEEYTIKEKIMELAYKLIDENKDEDANCKDIIEKMYENNHINKYTLDISTCLIDYIKGNIFNQYLKKVFKILGDNNIFTTLYENIKDNFKNISKNLVEEIITKYLDTVEKKSNYESKFLYNYNIPGFYNFFENISNYINNNIKSNYFNNEKKIRELLKDDVDKINAFYNNEETLLSNAMKEISDNHKFINDIIDKIPNDLILKDYITYFLQHYKNKDEIYNKDDIYHSLIEFLLKLRFNDEKRIIKGNEGFKINILLIKIMWTESNANYILNIFNIIENALMIFNYNQKKIINMMEELIFKEKSIKYIINEKKNTAHTKEVNECYYILLASICYCITSNEIKLIELSGHKKNDDSEIEISYYSYLLKEINKVLQKLNDDLYIYLNEMYIIDELIQVIELFKKNYNIEKINEIKNNMRENALIIQKNSSDSNIDSIKLSEELIDNFIAFYNLIMNNGDIIKKDKYFYEKVRYILFKEIKKIPDIMYRYNILEKVLEENEIIKKSNDLFQIVLKTYLKTDDKFKDNMNNILNGDDMTIKLIEKKLASNNLILTDTLLYLFEKTSLIYLKNSLNNKKVVTNLEDEPLEVIKKCVEFLDYYIFKPKIVASKLKEAARLFCLGYIKVYISMYIKMFNKIKDKKKIIDTFNTNSSIYKMIRIYIYKVLYNNYKIDAFINEENIKKFCLKDYVDFKNLIKPDELINIYKIDYKLKALNDDYYENSYKAIEKYKKDGFKNKIKSRDFDLKEYGVDNFYVVTYNAILSNLQIEKSTGNNEFYKNVCEPLFNSDKLLLQAIDLFYKPPKFKEIKTTYKINSNNINPILFGYRYCLNEIFSNKTNSIYYPLYKNNVRNLSDKLYPGNNTKFILAYSDIIKHFKEKPEEGCYVCLCENLYYHSVPSGFPGNGQLNMICPGCKKNIGSRKKGEDIEIVKRENYYRIFKDDDEINAVKSNRIKKEKLKEINYMTLQQFKEKHISQIYKKEKGIYICDKNSFINDMNVIRNLSQISYRILNYILYSNLFFSRIITNNREYDKYLPRKMNWADLLCECWNILKNELLKINICSIEEFMNYIFIELFPLLNKEKSIDEYDDLIKLEDKLETMIQNTIKKYKEEGIKTTSSQSDSEKASFINLLKEKYSKDDYKIEEYPFYEFLYYTDYLDENYISKKLEQMYENKYPVLKIYLENKNQTENDKYSLKNLYLFNNVLNLISEKYSNKISREYAEKNKIKDTEIYMDNKDLIDKFIEYYNSLDDIKENNKIKLSTDNNLCDFLIEDSNNFGKTYKIIYQKFIKIQNESLEPLLDIKISKGIFDKNCKDRINIQQINEREIFNLQLPKNASIVDVLFNSSYRKILDSETLNYKSYKEYYINFDMIEDYMTDLLLKNKKLLNQELTAFIYNNEVFGVQLSNIFTLFTEKYGKKNINLDDKVILFKFSENANLDLDKEIINDFISLIKYLNDKKKESIEGNEIKDDKKIYELINENLKESVSINFIKIFENNDGLTIDKTFSIFDYYLKLAYEKVEEELTKYKTSLSEISKEAINNYYSKKDPISKKEICYAIRLFSTLVLLYEEDKENKIQNNHNNFANYLKIQDLWTKEAYDSINKHLNEFKLWNVEINQIVPLYDTLEGDIDPNYFEDVNRKIQNENKQAEPEENPDDPFSKNAEEEEKEKEDNPFGERDGNEYDYEENRD